MLYLLGILFIIIVASMIFWAGKFLTWFLSPGVSFVLKIVAIPLLLPFVTYKIIASPIQVYRKLPSYYQDNIFKGLFATILFISGAILIFGTLIVTFIGIVTG